MAAIAGRAAIALVIIRDLLRFRSTHRVQLSQREKSMRIRRGRWSIAERARAAFGFDPPDPSGSNGLPRKVAGRLMRTFKATARPR